MTRPALACVALVLVAGCSRFQVRTVQDPAVRFSDYESWAWVPRNVAPPVDQRLQDRALERIVRAGVTRAMAVKGYAPGTVSAADLLVTYRLVSADRQVAGAPRGYVADGAGSWVRADWSSDSYERGSLVVDLYDRERRRLVWRGMATARLLPHLSHDARVERVTKAIDEIMAGAPAR